MSEYSLYDFTESLSQVRHELGAAKVVSVIKAWGYSPEGYGSWTGGFVVQLSDGRCAYISGWCDTSGWGCQDGVEICFAPTIEGLDLPKTYSDGWSGPEVPTDWDEYPSDLNNWIGSGSPDPDEV